MKRATEWIDQESTARLMRYRYLALAGLGACVYIAVSFLGWVISGKPPTNIALWLFAAIGVGVALWLAWGVLRDLWPPSTEPPSDDDSCRITLGNTEGNPSQNTEPPNGDDLRSTAYNNVCAGEYRCESCNDPIPSERMVYYRLRIDGIGESTLALCEPCLSRTLRDEASDLSRAPNHASLELMRVDRLIPAPEAPEMASIATDSAVNSRGSSQPLNQDHPGYL